MIVITDATDNVENAFLSMTDNNVEPITILYDMTNNTMGTPSDYKYGPVYMLNALDNNNIIADISENINNITLSNILTPEILQTFDVTILQQDDIIKDLTMNEQGFSWSIDCLRYNQSANIKYQLTLKEDIVIDRNIIYKTWYSSENITASYQRDLLEKKLVLEKEKTPTFTVCETYQVKLKAVNAKNASLPVAGIEFKVEAKDSEGTVVYQNTLTTDRFGYVTIEKIKTLGEVTYSIKPIVNIVGYEETEERNIIIDNDYLGRRVLEAKTDGLTYKVDDIERIVEVEMPIEVQGFDLELDVTELNNTHIKLSNTQFRLIQPKLNNKYEMEALYGTTNEEGKLVFHPAVMTKEGTYDYILSQLDEVTGYESIGNATLQLTFNKEGKITKAKVRYNDKVTLIEWKEAYVKLNIGNENTLADGFDFELNLTDANTNKPIVGANYNVTVTTSNNTKYTYGNNVTNEQGQIHLTLPGSGEVHIAIVEQTPAVGYKKSTTAKEFTIHRQDGEVKYAYGSNASSNNYFTITCLSVEDKVVVNTQSVLKTERNTVKIKAIDSEEMPRVGLENVEFSLVNTVNGNQYGPQTTNENGEVEFTIAEETQGLYEYQLIVSEVPYGYVGISEPVKFNIHFDDQGYIDSVSDINQVEKIEYQLTEDENAKLHTAYIELGIEMDSSLAYYFKVALTDIDDGSVIEGATYNIEIKSGDYSKKIKGRPTDANGLISTRIAVDTSKVTTLDVIVEQETSKTGYKADISAQEISVNLLNNQVVHTPEAVRPGSNQEGQIRYADVNNNIITYHHTNRKKNVTDILLNINITTIEKTSESAIGGKTVFIRNEAVKDSAGNIMKQILESNGEILNTTKLTSTQEPYVGYTSFENLQVIGARIPGEQEYELEMLVDNNLIRCKLTYKYNEYTEMVELVNVETVWGNRLIYSKNFSSYENEIGYISDINLEIYTDFDATGNLSLDLTKSDLETKNTLAGAKYDVMIERPDGTKIVRSNVEVFADKVELDGVYVPEGSKIYLTETTAPIGYECNDTVVLKVAQIDEYTNEVILEKEADGYEIPRATLKQEQSINTSNGMVQSQYTLDMFDAQSDKFKFKINTIDNTDNKGVEGYQFEIKNELGAQKIGNVTNASGEVITTIGGIYTDESSPKTYTIKEVKTGLYHKKLKEPIEVKVYFKADGTVDTNKTLNGQTDPNYATSGNELGKWHFEGTNVRDNSGNVVYDVSIIINVETLDPLMVEVETINKFTGSAVSGVNYSITPSVKPATGATNIQVSYAEAGISRNYAIEQTVPSNYIGATNLGFSLTYDNDGDILEEPTITSPSMKLVSYNGKHIKLQVEIEPKVPIAITNLYYFDQTQTLQGAEFKVSGMSSSLQTNSNGQASGVIGAFGREEDITYTITQTEAKYGYAEVDPFDIVVHYNENREITSVKLAQEDNRFVTANYIQPSQDTDYGYNQTDKGIITLTVLNYKAVTMNIENVDRQDPTQALAGTEYAIMSDIGTGGNGTTQANGIAVTYVGKSGFDKTLHYTIEEISPSFGHQSFGTKINLDVDFNEEGFITGCAITNNPSVENIATASTVTPIVTIEDNFTINIQLKNNPLMKFNITKVDSQHHETVIKDVVLEVTGVLDGTQYTKDTVSTNQYGKATANIDRTLDNRTMEYTIKETKKSPFYEWMKEEIKLEISYDETGKMQEEDGYRITAGNAYIDITNVDPDNFAVDMTIYNDEIKAFGVHLYTDDIYDNSKKVQQATWEVFLTDQERTGHVKDNQYAAQLISGRDANNDGIPDLDYGEDYQIIGEYTGGTGTRTLRLTTRNNWLPNQYLLNNKLVQSVYGLDSYEILIDVDFDDEGKIVNQPRLRTGKDTFVGWLLDERYVEISKSGNYGISIKINYYPKLQVGVVSYDMYTKAGIVSRFDISTTSAAGDHEVVKAGYIGTSQYSGRHSTIGYQTNGTNDSWSLQPLCNIENVDAPIKVDTEDDTKFYGRYIYLYETQEATSPLQYQKYRPRYLSDYYQRKMAKILVVYNELGEVVDAKTVEVYSNNNINEMPIITPKVQKTTKNLHDIVIDVSYAPITTAQITVKDEISGVAIGGVSVYPYGGDTSQTNTSYEYRYQLQFKTNENGQTGWTYWGANVANGKNIYKISLGDIKQGYLGSNVAEGAFRYIEVEVVYDEIGKISFARVLNKDGFDHIAAEIDESCYGTTQLKLIYKLKRKMGMQINKVDRYDNNIKLSAKFKITNNIDTSGSNSEFTINTGSRVEQLGGRLIANNTVEYTLSEVTVPDGYKPLDKNLKLIVKYRANGTVERAYPADEYSKEHLKVDYICQTPRGDNSLLYKDIELTIVNEPKFAIELELTDKFYENIKIDNVTFKMSNSEGEVAVGNLVTNPSGKIYTYIGAVHPGKTVTYTLEQETKASGYYKLTQPITFTVTFDHTGKPVDIPVLEDSYEQEYATVLTNDINRFRSNYTVGMRVYNMPEKVYLGINKYDWLTKNPLENVEFKVTVEENDTKHDIGNIVTNAQGNAIVQIDTFKEVESGRSVIYTIHEVQALDTYRKIQDFKVQILYDAKGGISSWQILSNESNLAYNIYKRGNTTISKMDDTYVHMKLTVPNDNTYDLIIKNEDINYQGLGIEGTKYDVSINGKQKNMPLTSNAGITKLSNLTDSGNIQIRIAERTIGEGYRANSENDVILEVQKAATGAYSLSLNTENMPNYTISETENSTNQVPEYKIELTEDTYVIVSINEEYGEIKVTFYNETKSELTLIKQDVNTKESLAGVEFKITKNDLATGEETVLTDAKATDANGMIYFDLGIAPQNTTVVYTFTELSQPEPTSTYQTILLPQTVTVTYDIYGKITNIITNSRLRTKAFVQHDNTNCRSVVTTIGNGTIDPKYNVKVVSEDIDTGRRINGSTFDVEIKTLAGDTLTQLPNGSLPNTTKNLCTDGRFYTDAEIANGGLRVVEKGVIQTDGVKYKGDIIVNISQTGFANGYVPGSQKVTGQIKLSTDFENNPDGSMDSILKMELQDNDGLEVTVDEQAREIIVTVKNESRVQLNIQKFNTNQNQDGSRNPISGVSFDITSQIITASNAIDTDLKVTTRQTGVDGITSEAIGKAYAGKTVVYTIHENAIRGFKPIEDIQIAVVYDLKGNINYVELLSAYIDILNWTDVVDSFKGGRDISISVLNTPIVGDYQVVLEKHDIDDGLYPDLIPGAEYEITVSEQFGETKTWTAITNQEGKIASSYFNGYGTINITIKELSAPPGYELDPAPKYITVFRNKDTGVIQKYSSDVNIDISKDNTVVYLKPLDKEMNNTYSIIIDKIDIDEGSKITDDTAEFEVTITKQEIPEEDYEEPTKPEVEEEMEPEQEDQKEEETKPETKQSSTENITYQETLKTMVTLDGRAMLRTIEAPEEEGTYTYTIKEIKVPEGYERDPQEVVYEVVFEKNDKGYMFIKSAKKISGEYASTLVVKDQALGFVLGNKQKQLIAGEDEYILNIYKVDEEGTKITDKAIFKITNPDGTTSYVETNEHGRLDLNKIKLPEQAGKVVYTIQEIMAPTGYELNRAPITLEITFEEVEGNIQIQEANINGEGAIIQGVQPNQIDMNIMNKKQQGEVVPPTEYDKYTLVINKLDSITKQAIPGAKFLLTLEDGQKLEVTTNEEGKAIIDTMKIPKEPGVYPYVIKELEAPEGYKLDSEYKVLEVTFVQNEEEIKMESANIVFGKNTSARMLEDGNVSVDILNEKEETTPEPEQEEYQLNIYKVDEDKNPITDTAIFKLTNPDGSISYIPTNENGKLDLAKIKFPKEATIQTYTIQEIMAPTGYEINKTPITLEITFEEIEGKIQIQEAKINAEGAILDGVQAQQIDISVINKKQEEVDPPTPPGEYDKYTFVVNKLDSQTKQAIPGAKFLLTLSDGQKLEVATNEEGKIIIDNMRVPEEPGVYPYVIKELEAPEGYKLDSEYKILEVTFVEVDGKIQIASAQIVSGKNTSVTILENGEVSVDVLNEKEGQVDPDDPNKPTDPDDPNKPTDPDDPNKPTDPDDPNKPTDPDDPNKPTDPDKTIGFDAKTEKYLQKVVQTYRDTNEVITEEISKKDGIRKLDIKKDRIKYLQLELTYKIIVTNIGDKEGTITSIVDKIPSLLYMDPSVNKGWILDNNIATYSFNQKVLKPGESVEVIITLHYDGRSGKVGNITNYATFESPDEKDMNNIENSNNIGKSTFILSVRTGQEWIIYTTLTITSLGILALGIVGIKKYVLNT